ncbi:hypothetical protein HMN09_00013800 [Mycena chlorophos]|uniref:Uncharacterized protein n=1 Tax=Mycena chlorophos TaxID=658473 RepID=A0A8H6TV82_MYCCL|nr:hypothetical protein HMN09_00013800 [Mycena chlorophos]
MHFRGSSPLLRVWRARRSPCSYATLSPPPPQLARGSIRGPVGKGSAAHPLLNDKSVSPAVKKPFETLSGDLAMLKEQTAALSGDIASTKEQIAALTAELASTKEQIAVLAAELASFKEKTTATLARHEAAFVNLAEPIVLDAAHGQLIWLFVFQIATSAFAGTNTRSVKAPRQSSGRRTPRTVVTTDMRLDELLFCLDRFYGHKKPFAATHSMKIRFIRAKGDWAKLLRLLYRCRLHFPVSTTSQRDHLRMQLILRNTLKRVLSPSEATRFVRNFARVLVDGDIPSNAAHRSSVRSFLAQGTIAMAKTKPDQEWAEALWMWEKVTGRKQFDAVGLSSAQLDLVL